MLTYHSGVVRGRTAFLTYLAIVVLALLSRDAAAQLAPTGGHYAGRASDTGHGANQVSQSGGFSAAVPFDFPPARGGLPIPVSVVYGARGMGAAGVGWDVPLSYVRRDMSLAYKRPHSESDVPLAEQRLLVSLSGQMIEFIQSGSIWVAQRGAPGMVLIEAADQWWLHDGNGLTYFFVEYPPISEAGVGIWLLKWIRGPGSTQVELTHELTIIPRSATFNLVSIDLTRVKYNYHPTAGPKHEIALNYDGATASPQAISIFGDGAVARMRKLVSVDVSAHADTSNQLELLSRYQLTYAADQDTGQPRLASVTVSGRPNSDGNAELPLASYSYGTATQMRVPTGGDPSAPATPYLSYKKTHEIRIPAGVGADEIAISRTLWEKWESDFPFFPPIRGQDGVTKQNLIDITGDGRPDLITTDQNGKLKVWRNVPGNAGVSVIDDVSKVDDLNDTTMTSRVLEKRTINRLRYDTDAKTLSVHEVWRKVIDVNGDGRLDLIDAAELHDAWVIYLNQPVVGHPSKIEWRRYTIPIDQLVERLAARGHKPFAFGTEPFGHHPHPHDGSKHLALERHTTGIEMETPACFERDLLTDPWEMIKKSPCSGMPNDGDLLVVSAQKTYTEWALSDFNADGYPDFIMNSSPVRRVEKKKPPSDDRRGREDGSLVLGVEPEDGDANDIEVAYNKDRLFLMFSATFKVKTQTACGIGLSVGDQVRVQCKAAGEDACGDTQIIDLVTGRGEQATQCEIADVNGDGLPDYTLSALQFSGGLSDGASFLGTGREFLPVAVMHRETVNRSNNNAYSACKEVPPDTLFGTSQASGLRDLNGDGLPDEVDGSFARFGTGAGFGPAIPIVIDGNTFGEILSRSLDACSGLESRTQGGFYDLDGDGQPEFLRRSSGVTIDVYQLVDDSGARALNAGRLIEIDNGHGALTKIQYRSAKDDGTTLHQVPFPEIVVSSIETIGAAELGGETSPTLYAYGSAELMFDPFVERYVFPGYARSIELKTVAAVVDFTRILTGSVARITDNYQPAPHGGNPSLDESFLRYLRVGRPRDVTVLAGLAGATADPWTMLAINIDQDARRIGGTHYEWDARADPGTWQNPMPSECPDLWDPYTYSFTGMNVCTTHGFIFLRSTSSWRGTAAPPATANVMTRTEVQSIDNFGRPLSIRHGNDTRRNDDDLCETRIYAAQTPTQNRVLSAVTTRRVSHCDASPASATATEHWEYDGLQGSVTTGFVTSHTVERRDVQSGQLLDTIRKFDAVYDSAGNPISITNVREDGATRVTNIGYDPYGLAPIHIEQTATDAAAQQTAIVRDPVTLDALSVTDPNQVVWNTTFDEFGRPVRTSFTPPGGSEGLLSTTSYLGFEGGELLGRRIVQTTFNDALDPGTGGGESQTSTSFLDELGRVRLTTASLGGSYGGTEMITGARLFDGAGRVIFEADPFPSTQSFDTAYGTTNTYNLDGTPHCSIRANGALSVQPGATIPSSTDEANEIYPSCTSHSFENGTEVTQTMDADSLLSGSPQAGVQHFAVQTAIGWVLERTTRRNNTLLELAQFSYDRLGHQVGMKRYREPMAGTQPVIWSWRYDSLGQLLELQEPDSVVRTQVYSDWGELLEQRSEAASTPVVLPERRVVMIYDGLGRMLHREERTNGAADPATLNSYEYDVGVPVVDEVQPTHTLGRLARATTPTGDVSFSYDALGRTSAQVFTDPQGDPYIQMSQYHADGALAAIDLRLPDTGYSTERIEYNYDSARRVRTMRSIDSSGVQTLYEAPDIDAFGRVRAATIGAAGMTANYADLGRRLPREIDIASVLGQRSVTYHSFDPLGRERGRTERIAGENRATTVTYDALGRLATSRRTDDGSTTLAENNFSYDALGNITLVNDLINHGGATLTYQTADRDRLCRIDYGTNPGGTTCNVVHDGLGNIVQQPTRTGQRTLSYYASGNVRSIHNETGAEATFRYDAFGAVQELDLTGTNTDARRDRRYGGMIERRDHLVGGQPHSFLSRNIPGPGFVASRRGADGPWIFELGGSRGNRFFVHSSGIFIQDVDYDPYGEPTSTGAQPGSFLYTTAQWNGGDSLAAFGVSHLGARVYDPVIGRFLSRDPLLISRTAATTNPYSFGFNDPINRSDPSGLDPDPEKNTGKCSGLLCTPLPLIVPAASWIGGLFSGGEDPPAWKVIKNMDDVIRPQFRVVTVPVPEFRGEGYFTPDGESPMVAWANAPRCKTKVECFAAAGPGIMLGVILAPFLGKVAVGVAVRAAPGLLVRAASGTGAVGVAAKIAPKAADLLRPGRMSNADFGKLIGWTQGGTIPENLAKTTQLIKELPGRIGALRDAGVTRQIAQQWADFYQNEAVRVVVNPNALARSRLMQAISNLLK